MKRNTITALVAVCVLGLAVGAIYLVAQHAAVAQEDAGTTTEESSVIYTCSMHPQVKLDQPGKCPICGMDLVAAEKPETPAPVCNCPWCRIARSTESADEDEMAQRMEMSGPAMLRCQIMMRLEVTPDDPAAILALKDELGLTDEQVGQLDTILAEAREKANAVLTPEQQEKLEGLDDTPSTMMEMHGRYGRWRGRGRGRQ